jgi:hypothetical protein
MNPFNTLVNSHDLNGMLLLFIAFFLMVLYFYWLPLFLS